MGSACRVVPSLLIAGFLTLVCCGCETTQEESAKLEGQAKQVALAQDGLSITRESADVKVLSTTVVHGAEGAAAVVTLSNDSAHALRAVPIAITVRDAGGRTLFQNNSPGLEAGLVSVPSLAAHGTLRWVDDQVPAGGGPASVRARVGEAPAIAGSVPQIAIAGVHMIDDPSNGFGAAGSVSNRSRIEQRNLVVFAVARRGATVVAAGRAVLPELAAGASLPFQAFFYGDPHGAQLEVSAPPTTLG